MPFGAALFAVSWLLYRGLRRARKARRALQALVDEAQDLGIYDE